MPKDNEIYGGVTLKRPLLNKIRAIADRENRTAPAVIERAIRYYEYYSRRPETPTRPPDK